jgi:hypothetical protein
MTPPERIVAATSAVSPAVREIVLWTAEKPNRRKRTV